MPQHNNVPKHQRKKKKGHAPAHQNTFAFKHNPNSKKTNKILELPNVHVCRRCHDKIEWRKKYRKYKPRTQPGKCNICQQKRVMAAYHTICDKCSTTEKAKTIVKEFLLSNPPKEYPQQPKQEQSTTNDNDGEEEPTDENVVTAESNGGAVDPVEEESGGETTTQQTTPFPHDSTVLCARKQGRRACCMCVKEFALPDPENEKEQDDPTAGRKLTLRQRKTLERQKEAARKKQNSKPREEEESNDVEDDDPAAGDNPRRQHNPFVDSDSEFDDSEDEDDPFLKAVGGSANLLTGEAYQRALLAKEQVQT